MRLIPAIDLKNCQVVRGVGGRRDEYRPIASGLTTSSRPTDVAGALVENFQPTELYVADLDAIAGSPPNWGVLAALRKVPTALWVDAGIREINAAIALSEAGIEGIVLGLESIRGPLVVEEAVRVLGAARIIFSLDLRGGNLLGDLSRWSARDALSAIDRVVETGVRRIVVLDLAYVGEGRGTGTEDLCRSIASTYRHLDICAGGGIRGVEDLRRLEMCGVTGALVASALHDGRIPPGLR